jgi:hypothetical protein
VTPNAPANPATPASPVTTTVLVTETTVYVYDLDKDPSDCIGLLPKPGCGKKPVDAGDRGGSLQYATFGIILLGLAVIFTVVFRNVLRADRRKAAVAIDPDTKWHKTTE